MFKLQWRNVTEREEEEEKLQKNEGKIWSLVMSVVSRWSPIVSSARAVSGRRLSSCDAHNQFF